jgi:hypothetical protein
MRSETHGLRHGLQDIARFAGSEQMQKLQAQADGLGWDRPPLRGWTRKCRNTRPRPMAWARIGRPFGAERANVETPVHGQSPP